MNWRRQILQNFPAQLYPLTVVVDPDALLQEEEIWQTLKDRGFDLTVYNNPLNFRFMYEHQYRCRWDRGEEAYLVVTIDDRRKLAALPYDILAGGRLLQLSLADLFPRLSYPVMAELDKEYFARLYRIYQDYHGPTLGDSATKHHILKHVFGIVPETIHGPVEITQMLLSRHCRGLRLPEVLDRYLVDVLGRKEVFRHWPLEKIVPSAVAFFKFLQRKWFDFVHGVESREPIIPFDRYDIRVYINDLFADGYLEPVDPPKDKEVPDWARAGVIVDREKARKQDLERLVTTLEKQLDETLDYRDWQKLAVKWAHLLLECDMGGYLTDRRRRELLQDKLDHKFFSWLRESYGRLAMLPYLPQPILVHQVPHFLNYRRTQLDETRQALLVIDGLAMNQWLVIRRELKAGYPNWQLTENQIFAWIPTLTPISRQALFAGKAPLYLAASLLESHKDGQHWRRFWSDAQMPVDKVHYGLLPGTDPDEIRVTLASGADIVGLVVRKVDDIMHGMKLGSAGMLQQIALWAQGGYLNGTIDQLLKNGFVVYLTADHGNVAATGQRTIPDGILAEARGQRARIYTSKTLVEQAAASADNAVIWPPVGLPAEYKVLLAKGRSAFTQRGQTVVAHGGTTLEEVIVPFIRIEEAKS
ncbi:MAG: BREX-3 system phosphatase PglZ [bacterium]